ncbi:UTRA domain-containing protein [Streptosporangium sp. NBC_01755]|uniref:GntR family transcriptional regulator n=1 Tax=unclassified Streptosporangium TaxID=2632669 RepID=UPI002DD9E70A|nr:MULTISPECIES: UTRA domain-containing protein [unclassified Streptosporangium]WSA25864.1 UTRA domain-containing protein [Streptosporangium sp. NBC_01810]WSD02743.1 UTRA domain-containing protein [Streptosporangium sp. NBC_01755]
MDLKTLRDVSGLSDPIERARLLGRLMTEEQELVEEAAKMRRQAIAEARDSGMGLEEIGARLGVSPGRISQMRKGPTARTPEGAAARAPKVLVRRALPTDPAVRASASLFLVEAERQGIRPDRRMLYVGPEPASDHVAACLRVEPGAEVIARRKMMTANEVPVRIATSYFRVDLFGRTRIAEPEFVKPSLQSALVALGHAFGHAEEDLTARPPTSFEYETLELEPGEWVVQVLRAGYSSEDTPVHVLETICAANRHVFSIGQVSGYDEF